MARNSAGGFKPGRRFGFPEKKPRVPELSTEDKAFAGTVLSIFKYHLKDKTIRDPEAFSRYVVSNLPLEQRAEIERQLKEDRSVSLAAQMLPRMLEEFENGKPSGNRATVSQEPEEAQFEELQPIRPLSLDALKKTPSITTAYGKPRILAREKGPSPERVRAFARGVDEKFTQTAEQVRIGLQTLESLVADGKGDSSMLQQLETFRIANQYIHAAREAQQIVDTETRFFFADRFMSFVNKHKGEAAYKKKGAGGMALLLAAVQSAKQDVIELQRNIGNPDTASKVMPNPIAKYDLKTWQNKVSLFNRTILSALGTVMDSGTVVSVGLGAWMAHTGKIVSGTDPLYIGAMLVTAGTLGNYFEGAKRDIASDDISRSDAYLPGGEKVMETRAEAKRSKGRKSDGLNDRVTRRQVMAALTLFGYSGFQFETVITAVAGAQDGGEAYREVRAGRDQLDPQLAAIYHARDFNAASLDGVVHSSPQFEHLSPTEQFFVDLHRKPSDILNAEFTDQHIEGAGGGGHGHGYGPLWGGKYGVLMGANPTEEVPASALEGVRAGIAARHQIQEEFVAQLQEISLDPPASSAAERAHQSPAQSAAYLQLARELVQHHFENQGGVLIDGVSFETQVHAFYNDFVGAIDEPTFILLNSSGQQEADSALMDRIRDALAADERLHLEHHDDQRMAEGDRQLLEQVTQRGGTQVSLRELMALYEVGALQTGYQVSLWSDDPLDPVRTKLAQASGIATPNRTTLRTHILNIEDVRPLFEYLQDKLFRERTELLARLVQEKLNTFDSAGGSTQSGGIAITIPHLSIDTSRYEIISTENRAKFGSVFTHVEAFKNFENAGLSLGLLSLILLINFGPSGLMRRRIEKTEQSRREEFWSKRKQFEGEGDRKEGSEYLLAEHMSERFAELFGREPFQSAFPGMHFSPDIVLSAMREAAAEDEFPVVASSPFHSPDTALGKVFHAMSEYPHGLAHIVMPTGLPEPPAVKAFNHLITLYKDPVALTVRIAEQLLPGFSEMLETALSSEEAFRLAALPPEEFKRQYDLLEPSRASELAAVRATMLARVNDVSVGHEAFIKRYAKSKIDHLTEAFGVIYGELSEIDEQDRAKFLDLSKRPIDLLTDDLDAFDANNPGSFETMRESGLRQTIAAELETEFFDMQALLHIANKELNRINERETMEVGLFGGAAGKVFKDAQVERRKRLDAVATLFNESSDPHVNQFSSQQAIRTQVFQDVKRRALESWYKNADERERTKNWVGIPVKEQLKGIQDAIRNRNLFLLESLPTNKRGDTIDASALFKDIRVGVTIESRSLKKKKRMPQASAIDTLDETSVAPEFTKHHLVVYSYFDSEGTEIFREEVPIRSDLSKLMSREKLKERVERGLKNRTEYFSTRVLLDSIDSKTQDAKQKNEQEIKEAQARLGKLGFAVPTPKDGETFDTVPVNLTKKNAVEAMRIYMTELAPRLARRTVLSGIEGRERAFVRNVEERLKPRYDTGKVGDKVPEDTRSLLQRSTRLYLSLEQELLASKRAEGEAAVPGTLESRVNPAQIRQMEGIVQLADNARRELQRNNITISFFPKSPEYLSVTRGPRGVGRILGGKTETIRVKASDMLEQIGGGRGTSGAQVPAFIKYLLTTRDAQ